MTIKKKEVVRDYTFSDGFLVQRTDKVIGDATRDSSELIPEGVTALRLTTLGNNRDTFDAMKDDEEWEGEVSEKAEGRDAAATVCELAVNSIRTKAQNVWGEKKAKYRSFGFDGINELPDEQRIKAYRRVHRRATLNLLALAPEGLTPLILTNFNTANGTYDNAIDELNDKISDRDIATEDRRELGNLIYAEDVKICNTGKNYWLDKDEAKYNDYVIYNTPSGAPEAPLPV